MIDLYALTSPNVQKIYIMLEECGLPYKEHYVDVWKGEQYKPEFGKINPNNKIPAIVDHDGPGGKPYTVIESGAILIYLAKKSGKFMPQGRGQEIRRAAMADDPAHRGRADVRPMDPFQAVRAQGQRRLFDGALHVGDKASLRGAGDAARQGALSRRPGLLHRRHRDLPMDAQPRRPGREVGGQSQSRALVQRHQRAPRGQGRARQDWRHQVEPRDRLGRRQGSLLQSRPLRQGVTWRARDFFARVGITFRTEVIPMQES